MLVRYTTLAVGFSVKATVVGQVVSADGVGFDFVETAIEGAQQGAVIFDGECPAVEQDVTVGAQA